MCIYAIKKNRISMNQIIYIYKYNKRIYKTNNSL